MKIRRGDAGYTVVEVLIVMAVTAALFVSVAISLSGRQREEEYIQSVRSFEARMQTIVDEVLNGVYPRIDCLAADGTAPPTLGTSSTTGGCVFIGKILESNDADQFNSSVATVIGRRTVGLGSLKRPVDNLAEANPVVVSARETSNHTFRLRVRKIVRVNADGSGTEIPAIGFFVPLSGASASVSGGRQTALWELNPGQPVEASGQLNDAQFVSSQRGVVICLGNDPKFAEIEIGRNQASQSIVNTLLNTRAEGVCA